MSNKFYSRDLPAAWAYAANPLSACGYEAEAEIIRKDSGFKPDASLFVRDVIADAAAKLAGLWAKMAVAKAPARQVQSVDLNS